MKKLVFLLPFFFFSCKDKNNSSDTTAELKLSARAKDKIRQAYALIQQYARETKVMPKEVSDAYITCYREVVFGKMIFRADSSVDVGIEKGIVNPRELLIAFEDGLPLPPLAQYAATNYFDGRKALISFNTKVAETMSPAVVASVLIHELAHLQFFALGLYQEKDEKTQAMNEGAAYLRQISFLMWKYGGAEEEAKFSLTRHIPGNFPALRVPEIDWPHFSFFYDKEEEMGKIILK